MRISYEDLEVFVLGNTMILRGSGVGTACFNLVKPGPFSHVGFSNNVKVFVSTAVARPPTSAEVLMFLDRLYKDFAELTNYVGTYNLCKHSIEALTEYLERPDK